LISFEISSSLLFLIADAYPDAVEAAKRILADVIPRIPTEANWPEHTALDSAFATDRKLWPKAMAERLKPILERFL
jgi:5'-methylthioadenosine phosphorylase